MALNVALLQTLDSTLYGFSAIKDPSGTVLALQAFGLTPDDQYFWYGTVPGSATAPGAP